jgi:hypothetical protein
MSGTVNSCCDRERPGLVTIVTAMESELMQNADALRGNCNAVGGFNDVGLHQAAD